MATDPEAIDKRRARNPRKSAVPFVPPLKKNMLELSRGRISQSSQALCYVDVGTGPTCPGGKLPLPRYVYLATQGAPAKTSPTSVTFPRRCAPAPSPPPYFLPADFLSTRTRRRRLDDHAPSPQEVLGFSRGLPRVVERALGEPGRRYVPVGSRRQRPRGCVAGAAVREGAGGAPEVDARGAAVPGESIATRVAA